MPDRLTHFDEAGNAVMVDISGKENTQRVAVAKGIIAVSRAVFDAISGAKVQKGDVLGVARIAGIMAVKRTAELIPLCHPLIPSRIAVDFALSDDPCTVEATCTVGVTGRTGAEMEALTGVSMALLTVYDMCKAIDKGMTIQRIYLAEKSGGKSGDYQSDNGLVIK